MKPLSLCQIEVIELPPQLSKYNVHRMGVIPFYSVKPAQVL